MSIVTASTAQMIGHGDRMEQDDDSLEFDITISGSSIPSAEPLTPPPTIRKSMIVRLQSRLAFCAVCVFVLCIVVSIILVMANAHKIKT